MESEKVFCPYCGGKMRFWNEGTAGYFICVGCNSQSPLVLFDDPYRYIGNKQKTIEKALQRANAEGRIDNGKL